MQKNTVDWEKIRAQFPIFMSKIYINSCSYGALSLQVEKGFEAYLADRYAHGSDWYNWVDQNEGLRNDYADLFGATPDEIAVTTSASAGINAIASSLDFSGSRNKVIITELEFPTNSQIWFAQEKRGAKVVRVQASTEKTLLERLAEEIDETTRIVAVTHVCYRNGTKLDIKAIRDLARKNGAYIMIDGFQTIGTMDIDFTKLDVDFYVGGTLKYLLGTAGVAFLYANKKLTGTDHPSVTGWFAQNDIHAMDDTRYNPSQSARRFEAGTPPVPNIYAARAGLSVLKGIGLHNIETRVAMLTADIVERAQKAGYTLATPTAPHQRGAMVAIKSTDEHALVAALDAQDIVTSCRDGNLRLSPHFYNTRHDIAHVFTALGKTALLS
jgi:selenocysteine lyase/cysteine desulfurase